MKNDKGQETNDQSINRTGRARLLSVGKFVPKDWGRVRVTRTKQDEHNVWIHIRELTVRLAE